MDAPSWDGIHKKILAIIVYMDEEYTWDNGQTGQPSLGISMDEEIRSDFDLIKKESLGFRIIL